MILHFEILNETTITANFDCDEPELNVYFNHLALLYQNRHFGVTIVCFENSSKKNIVGYYTLCPASVQQNLLPEKIFTGPKPNPIPGFRLCRLAVDTRFQKKGMGKILFVHSLKKCIDQSNEIGGSVVIIDAKHVRAKQFYERFGFISLPNSALTLIQTMKFIKKHF